MSKRDLKQIYRVKRSVRRISGVDRSTAFLITYLEEQNKITLQNL